MLPAIDPSLWSSLIGGAAWCLGVGFAPGLAEALLLLGPLVAVPLGLSLAPLETRGRTHAFVGSAARWIQLPAALLLLPAFALPPGAAAAALAVPWLLVTAAIALLGAIRLQQGGLRLRNGLAIGAGHLFILVGGVWMFISRLGVPFLGFGEPIALLTAAHFHFAGFILPLLTGLAAEALPGAHARIAVAGVVTGVPLLAAGITLSASGPRHLEWAGAWWMSAAAVVAAALQLRLALRARSWGQGFLLGLSAAALMGGMALAASYGLARGLHREWIDIPGMVRYHATLNVLGFALPGLVAWKLRAASRAPRLDGWEARGIHAGTSAGPMPGDHRDAHVEEIAVEEPGPPVPGGPFERAADAILRYDVFPARLVRPVLRRQPVEIGDTVGCLYHLAPGLDLFFAARVTDRFRGEGNGTWRAGFTYRTIEGHPMLGEETFSVEKDMATGRIHAAIRSWSRPAWILIRLVHPVARRLQLRAGRMACRHIGEAIMRRPGPARTEPRPSAGAAPSDPPI